MPPGVNASDIPGNEPEPTLAEIARDLYEELANMLEHTEARCVTVGDCNAARRALEQAEGRT